MSVAEIAQAAGTFPSQVTYYFGSKEALFVEAACRPTLRAATDVERAGARTRTPHTYVRAVAGTALASPALLTFVEAALLARHRPDLAPLIGETFARLHAEGERAIVESLVARGWQIRATPAAEGARLLGRGHRRRPRARGARRAVRRHERGSHHRAGPQPLRRARAARWEGGGRCTQQRSSLTGRDPRPGHHPEPAAGERLRVVVADDAVLLRAAIVRLLTDAGFDVVAQAGDRDDLLRKVRAHRPDVAVVDVRMPPDHRDEGVQAVRAIRADLPQTGVLLLSQYIDDRFVTELLEHGAEGVGYLVKDRIPDVERFTDAVRSVAHRGAVLDPEVVHQMLGRRRSAGPLDAMSDRERAVLAEMAAGATNRAIAARMFLSERAIERDVTAIFRRLGLTASRHAHRRVLAVLAYLEAA